MNTYKTPAALADEQDSGRVRLGDALLPCPLCGNDAEFVPYKNNGLTLKCKSMGCIQRHQRTLRYGIEWLRTSMTEHWNTRALSAQPSPGGQGDDAVLAAVAGKVTALVESAHYHHRKHVESALYQVLPVLRDALAARQPVGELVGYLFTDDPAVYAMPGSGFHHGAEPPANAINVVPLYAAPPAQAVDLDAVRESVQRISLGFNGDLPYIKGITEALALIDKAVGNG